MHSLAMQDNFNSPVIFYSFYNANETTLKFSLEHGAAGYSGVAANFYPWIHTWLCEHWKDQPRTAEKVQQFLSLASTTSAQKVGKFMNYTYFRYDLRVGHQSIVSNGLAVIKHAQINTSVSQ